MNTKTRLLAVLAGVAVASVSLSGCLFTVIPDGGAASSQPASSPTPDAEGVASELLPFYTQTIDWSSCAGADQCADIDAPLDWNDPGKGKVSLSIIKHGATGTSQGALLVNPGGPGASGVELIRDSLDYAVGSTLAEHYDVIGFDPRGVGGSTAVKCFNAKQMDAYLFDIPSAPRNTAEWREEVLASAKGFAQACEENSGGILPYITTEFAARDMDLMRAVLGDKKLNYLGYSYGTFLGATYAKLYPQKVGRFVLDGALDPSTSSLEVSVTQGVGFESALRAYMASCLKTRGCPFSGTVDDAMSSLGALFARVDKSPLRNTDGRMLGADAMLTSIVAALYSQDSWQYLTQSLAGIAKGNPSIAFQLADFYYNRVDGKYQDNSQEAFTAYNCMDYPNDATDAQIAAAQATLKQKAPVIAPYWNVDIDGCESWPAKATGVREEIHAAGAGPILVIGTTNDPATPYTWAQALAKQLDSGILITRVGEGHTGFNKGNSCVDDTVNDYFVDGTVPDADVRCD
ncbi:alpha/beta hydrolase [Microbacterium horticulturae]|uniref:Alpha/beta hydrolase n=1 Tax=Microbacterium horticulturae TaxID=3028316 RepID=A0ABY8C0N2_9MICO|nr:alpha/beta hydrolase [Microbacterium sp. KACC 23027]WEG09815.1 alpha/beta hydrolase [Microbacterium sp. KACC 23027]